MKRKSTYILLLLICFVVSLMAVPVHAASAEGTYGNNIHWHFDSDTGTLTISGTGTATGIPLVNAEGKLNTEGYMQYYSEIRHLVIGDGFTGIGDSAFARFLHLESIHIGDAVEGIGTNAFYRNSRVTQLHLGANVVSVGPNAFEGLSALQELTLPASVRNIGSWAFAFCGVAEVTIPEGVTKLLEYAFAGNHELTQVSIPASITEIKDKAFVNCAKLTDVYYAGTESQWEDIYIGHTTENYGGDTTSPGNASLLSATKHYNQTSPWQEKTDDSATEPTEQTVPTEPATQPTETNVETTPTVQTVPQDNTTNPAETRPDTGNTQEEKPNNILWITVGVGIASVLLCGGIVVWFCLRKNKK